MGNSESLLVRRHDSTSRHLIDEGEAMRHLMSITTNAAIPKEHYDVVVIGGGQAGLSVGYHLAKRRLRFLILDSNQRIGDSWRKRWDSLRLFTPARYDGLDGLPFPGSGNSFPTKDEMGDYLEAYASKFQLPVRNGFHVERLFRRNGYYIITSGTTELQADQVVVAMSNYQAQRLPAWASALRTDIVQIHSSEYRNPGELRPGGVLIVGAGNSGSEIAMEVAPSHQTWMAGRDTGHIPFRINGFWGRALLAYVVLRLVFHYVLTIRTPMGRKARARSADRGGPLIRVKPEDLQCVGVHRVARMLGVKNGLPLLDGDKVLDINNVIWCTGYSPNFSWIELAVLDSHGEPVHQGGAAHGHPGLYFVGLHFLYAMSSTMIHGVGRDAARIAQRIAEHAQGPSSTPQAPGEMAYRPKACVSPLTPPTGPR